LEENLNYRAETLMKLWPKRFPTLEFAKQYEKNPRKIANSVYANRMGNRDEASGDGYRFRGRGAVQLTGYSSYFHAGQALGADFVMEPDLNTLHSLPDGFGLRTTATVSRKKRIGRVLQRKSTVALSVLRTESTTPIKPYRSCDA
jgi:hypothetical protein